MAIEYSEEQKRIIGHRAGNMIVSASAGSGKTTVMLERVVNMIEEGTPLDAIVILAFNNAIAAEIRAKLYKKLMARLSAADCKSPEFIKQQIDRLPLCNIITNDSYCNRTANEFFGVLGTDPAADILGEVEGKVLFSQSFVAALTQLKQTRSAEIYELLLKFGGEENVYAAIRSLHNFVAAQAGGMQWLDAVIAGVYTDDIKQSDIMTFLFDLSHKHTGYIAQLFDEIVSIFEGYADVQKQYADYAQMFRTLSSCEDYESFRAQILAFKLARRKGNTKKTTYAVDMDRYVAVREIVKGEIADLAKLYAKSLEDVQAVHHNTIRDIKLIVMLYKDTLEEYNRHKEKLGKYDFTDFVENTIKLLDTPEIQQELSSRYEYICVDEYQDTNYAQEGIYTKMSNGDNLFMVGDSKQSIYRFRQSEPKILLDKYNDYQSSPQHGSTIRLASNFRSDKGIVKFVNMIFNRIMTHDFGGIDYEQADQLRYGARYDTPPMAPSYEIHLFDKAEGDEQKDTHTFDEVYSVREHLTKSDSNSAAYREGQFIADKIKQIVGSYTIYDTDLKATRTVQYSDIALLARKGKGALRDIIKALQDNLIPVDIAPLMKAGGIYEVEIIKDIMRLVVSDADDNAIAAVLVSFFVGMDYDDLLDIRAKAEDAEYFWQAVRAQRQSNAMVAKLYDMLDELRLMSSYSTIKQLADHIVYDYAFDRYILTLEGGDFKLSALKTYLSSLSDISDGCSLYEYVSTLDDDEMQIQGGAAGNMVRAMTIHKSKGLEFPVVFLCNIDGGLTLKGGVGAPKILMDKDAGIAINYFDEQNMVVRENLAFKVLRRKNDLDDKAEAMRLLYVALTRPKNHIILTGCVDGKEHKAKSKFKADSFLDWVLDVAAVDSDVEAAITYHDKEDDVDRCVARYTFRKSDAQYEEIADYLNFEYAHKKAQSAGINYSVTEINKQGGATGFTLLPNDLAEDGDVQRRQVGTAYHAVLQHIDLAAESLEEVKREISRMLSLGLISEDDAAVVDAQPVVKAMNSRVMCEARKGSCYREQQFTLKVTSDELFGDGVKDEVLVQGVIDMLIWGDSVWVVDYKKSDEPREVLKARYSKQLQLYCKAVREATGRQVDKALLYVIGSGEEIDIPID